MSGLRNFLDRAKGQAVSLAGKQILAVYLERYGAMLNFSVDSEKKILQLEMLLKGESEPIQLTLSDYEIVQPAGEAPVLRVGQVAASREWVEVALREFVRDKSFALPAKVAPLLKLLL